MKRAALMNENSLEAALFVQLKNKYHKQILKTKRCSVNIKRGVIKREIIRICCSTEKIKV